MRQPRDPTPRTTRAAMAIAACGLAVGPVHAKRKQPAANTIALFGVAGAPKGKAGIANEVGTVLETALGETGATVLAGAELKRRLKAAPRDAIARCKGRSACIIRLCKRSGASKLVYGRARGDRIVLAVIDCARAKDEQRVVIQVGSRNEVRGALAAVFSEIFALDMPASLRDIEPTSYPEPSPGIEPLDDLELAAGPEPSADDDSDAIGPLTPVETALGKAAIDPAAEPELPLETITAEPPAAATSGDVDLPLESIGAEPPPVVTSEPIETSDWMLYTAIAVAATGALTAGVGLVFGIQSFVEHGAVESEKVAQPPHVKGTDAGNAAADRATLLYVIGGALVLVGGVLFAIDVVVNERFSPSVSVNADGAQVSLQWHF